MLSVPSPKALLLAAQAGLLTKMLWRTQRRWLVAAPVYLELAPHRQQPLQESHATACTEAQSTAGTEPKAAVDGGDSW